jgi:uncharacterized protein
MKQILWDNLRTMVIKLFSKIFPPKEKIFFKYFVDSAHICRAIAEVCNEIINEGPTEQRYIRARALKNKSNELTREVLNKLNLTFITPIDREDIQHINNLLNKVTRKITKVVLILATYNLPDAYPTHLKKQAEILLEATNELIFVISKFKNFKEVDEIADGNIRMKEIEVHGDDVLHQAMIDLFSGKYDTQTVIKLKDIYNHVESALDVCFSISDTIVSVILKHT